jgi:DNA-binding response OmpR family regulator
MSSERKGAAMKILVASKHRATATAIAVDFIGSGHLAQVVVDTADLVATHRDLEPHAVLLDTDLTETPGICQTLRRDTCIPELAIILMAEDPPTMDLSPQATGADEVVTQPSRRADLVRTVEAIVGFHRERVLAPA